ncbi:hypothetical protein [Winogradskyella sp. 3972H.M.0a.05]|uniref:hypothetical protein n=1 Tax=Winogradskyella sp. 3972H.M.0a.05 TaxID=2950277 RepID=UPI0033938986
MKLWMMILCLCFGLTLNAQEDIKSTNQYQVKKGRIYLDDKDVTETFTVEQRKVIIERLKKASEEAKTEKVQKKKEKALRKAEKAEKKAKKAAKKAERALRKKEKAQKGFDKATKALNKANRKYEKLKSKGKLSPEDERKMLEKIEKLTQRQAKAKRKM